MYRWQMTEMGARRAVVWFAVAVLAVTAAGCSTAARTAGDGEDAFAKEDWDAAVYHYLQALAEDPDNDEYKL